MSAYIVEKNHILYLLTAAMSSRITKGHSRTFRFYWNNKSTELRLEDFEGLTAFANRLWQENIKSVSHRYPGESTDTLPGPVEEIYEITIDDIPMFTPAVDPVQVIKSIDCYSYQSNEHDEWETSEAFAFCAALRNWACCALVGYDDCVWGAPELKPSRKFV